MDKAKQDFRHDLTVDVKFLKGIGEFRARQLGKLGIHSVADLMEHFPRDYISRRVNQSIFEMQAGERVALTATISWRDIRLTQKGKPILNIGISDGRSLLVCSWFSYPKAFEALFEPGRTIWVSGLLSDYNNQMQLLHPDFEMVDEREDDDFWKQREFLPVYPLSGDLTQKFFRKAIYLAFSLYADKIEENLPQHLIDKYSFTPRKAALQKMHFSSKPTEIETLRTRFAYEELFYSQILWARHRYFHGKESVGITFENKRELTSGLYNILPFKLTGAQKRVLREIFADMTSPKQMSRLLQGDVGSGKTIVVLFAMLLAVENGMQAALMAPTEILADQHYTTITTMLQNLPLKVALLKGGNYKGKSALKTELAEGNIDLLIGTHALIQSDVSFKQLGFVAVDEQHRFGVQQRAMLARKDAHPDLLYLSATPIPRSLSMTVYGDLEVSTIDEMPPNRKPVQTYIRSNNKIDLVYNETRKELAQGRQVYIVCPLIEESDKIDLLDAERLYKHISVKVFPEYKSALLHGRMPSQEKDRIMLEFKRGEHQILVSTTVIEVGMDVPNASVMIVEHAERFGLAQLHQLRGRVGRGAKQSWCYLIEHFPVGKIARERLSTLAGSTDGFVIAEKDLELRGPGEFFGTEQSGMPGFRFASLIRDQHILKLARNDAFEIISADPDLSSEANAEIKKLYALQYTEKEKLILY